ncbi:MAG TPA: catalase [Candidatus Scybalocola faecavium]|nr:catalase [Candidatus Scybalocola faecavium]
MNKLIGHFKTITYHKWLVMNYCFKVGLYKQGLLHDLSKYSPAEFITGVRYYQGGKRSPNAKERELFGYSGAWLHHKGRNKHHYEYWNDVGPDKILKGVKMPLNYVVEMVMDRIAASRVYKGENYTDQCPLEYFNLTKDYILIHPKTRALLEKLLKMLAKRGQVYTFKYIKKVLLPKGDY